MRALPIAAALAAVFAATPTAEANKTRYVYVVTQVSAAEGVAAPTEDVAAGLAKGIAARAELDGKLPAEAPDPESEPKKFKKFIERKGLRAYRVNLEITAYDKTVETLDERGHKRVGVHIDLRLFGETMPDRVMAFAGRGSATVKLDVGKDVRDRDLAVANRDAIEVAIEDAIAESLRKLETASKKRKKRKKRRRKK